MSSPKIQAVEEIVIHFSKRLHLRCLNGYRMCHCCVLGNYLSVSFATQPQLLHFFVFSGDSKFRLFQMFHFSMKLIHLHYNWQQDGIGEFGDIFQSVPTKLRDGFYRRQNKIIKALDLSFNLVFEYEKIKAHKVCILSSILYYQLFFMNAHDEMRMMIKYFFQHNS